jgi:hypothetical protein
MRLLLPLIACAAFSLAFIGGTEKSFAQSAAMCPDGTGPATIGKPYEPTAQGSYCDVRGGGARPHKGVDMMQSEGYQAPIPVGCKIMMNGNSPIWCQGNPTGVSGYGYYLRFACGKRMGPDGKEYKVEVRYAHVKGYDATLQKAIVSCSGCVGITPHVHYETLVEGRKVNPVCVWGEGISNNVSCPQGLSKPANLCDGNQLKILHEQACMCPSFGCAGPGATTSMQYHEGVDPGSLSGNYGPNGGGSTCPAQNDSGGTPNDPGNPPGGSGGSGGGGSGGEGPDGDGGQGTPNPNYQENEEGCSTCCCPCTQTIIENQKRIRRHVDVLDKDDEQSEFEEHRNWMVYTFLQQHILPAMMMMTSQLTAVGIEQVRIIGTFLDAKHQLETQRMFQQMAARAHKDYHPSEGMCEVGTMTRSLLASERRSDLTQMAIAEYSLKRQLFSGDIVSAEAGISDVRSRLGNFIANYCDVKDNDNGLNLLCKNKSVKKDRQNADIDYMRSLESKLTLELDIIDRGEEGAFNFDGFATKYASLVPESGKDFQRYVRKAQNNHELGRLSGSGMAAGLVSATPGGGKITLIQTVQNPIAVDDLRTLDSDSNSIGGNVFDNDGVDPLTTKVTKIKFKNEQKAVPEMASILIDGLFGTLTIHGAGNFTYALHDFAAAYGQKETFTYTITAAGIGEAEADIIITFPSSSGSGGGGSDGGGDGSGNGSGGSGGNGNGSGSGGNGGGTGSGGEGDPASAGLSEDFENVLSMGSFLYASKIPSMRPGHFYANEQQEVHPDAVPLYMDMRSLVAKRSVAVNSFAAIAGERVSGDPEAGPFIKRIVAELGIPENEVEQITGKNPSYFAQMEILTKKIYENPTFYTELYDKPGNVARKGVALKAIGLMQDRDMYQSMLRTEMLGSILLESILVKQQEVLKNKIRPQTDSSRPVLKGGGQ